MKTVKITSKRQATLPLDLCEDLGVGPGDHLHLEARVEDGETIWVLRAPGHDWSWFGAARSFAENKSHDWDDIEKSIGRSMADDRS